MPQATIERTSERVRREFIEFFEKKHAHTFVPSSPVVPHDDPTLLFANAGMNQFKPIFLGTETRDYTRAVNSQKCIRAGGKHNDLDDVGKDTYHHTFFEMLGNWSFGDYFKAEAIEWAWELLTKVWKLDPERLHATYFEGDPAEGLEPDNEARELWKRYLPDSRIHPGNKKDNFWEMGDTGPCGPCSEIHFDRTPDKSGAAMVNGDSPLVIEIWNLVFIQFNRTLSGLKPLPAKHVDTGMGFERICAVLEGKISNYDTDVFAPLLAKISELSGQEYKGKLDDPTDIAFRVIADHARMATFAITDGARPGNKKRDAVLRSVIRRAVRYGYTQMGLKEPFVHKLVGTVVEEMGGAFPELRERPEETTQIMLEEEESFLAVIDRGIKAFDDAAEKAKQHGNTFAGSDIFYLHSTLGFPGDMTMQLARERGLKPDVEGYEEETRKHEELSGGGRAASVAAIDFGQLPPTEDSPKYDGLNATALVLAWVRPESDQAETTGTLREGDEAALVLDRTGFYAEQGGQIGDVGTIRTANGEFEVRDTRRLGDRVLHHGVVTTGTIEAGAAADLAVNTRRSLVMANHTVTHLLNLALRQVLGDHVEQRGSLVDDEKTRFDFTHGRAMTRDEIVAVERRVNAAIRENLPVQATVMPLEQAKGIRGVRAVFGEKYPDPVRVISVTRDEVLDCDATVSSVEFCGGTHTKQTGDIGFFKLISEENVSKGVRRVVGVTGPAALAWVQKLESDAQAVAQALSSPLEQAPARLEAMREEIRTLKKKLASGGGGADPVAAAGKLLAEAKDVAGGKLLIGSIPDATDDQLRSAMDSLKAKSPTHAILLATAGAEKVSFVAAVSDDLIKKGLKAGDWVREVAKITGGGGGGRPQMAQAGGKDPSKLEEALHVAREFAGAKLG